MKRAPNKPSKKQEMGKEINPLSTFTISEVTTRKLGGWGSPWRAARLMVDAAMHEQSIRDDARIPNAGKRYK